MKHGPGQALRPRPGTGKTASGKRLYFSTESSAPPTPPDPAPGRFSGTCSAAAGTLYNSPVETRGDNFSEDELRKFEAAAHRWWDLHGDFKPLHDINPLRLGYIESRTGLSGRYVVDVGCGGGLLCEAMARRSARVTGIDLGETAVSVARLHTRESGLHIDYRQVTAETLAGTDAGKYDVVTCLELLEHIPVPAATVAACARLAKDGGDVFFSTINRNLKSYLTAVIAAEYVLRLLPRGTHDYRKLIRPSELAHMARVAELELCDLTGMSYRPLSRTYELTRDVSVNYLAHFRKPL